MLVSNKYSKYHTKLWSHLSRMLVEWRSIWNEAYNTAHDAETLTRLLERKR